MHAVPVIDDLNIGVREIFAEVTRYPLEVLDPASGLEEDLGIDSVKLGEVFAVLREKYNLPEKRDIPRERLKTIAGIAEALHDYLQEAVAAAPKQGAAQNQADGPGSQSPVSGNGNRDLSGVQASVREIF